MPWRDYSLARSRRRRGRWQRSKTARRWPKDELVNRGNRAAEGSPVLCVFCALSLSSRFAAASYTRRFGRDRFLVLASRAPLPCCPPGSCPVGLVTFFVSFWGKTAPAVAVPAGGSPRKRRLALAPSHLPTNVPYAALFPQLKASPTSSLASTARCQLSFLPLRCPPLAAAPCNCNHLLVAFALPLALLFGTQ